MVASQAEPSDEERAKSQEDSSSSESSGSKNPMVVKGEDGELQIPKEVIERMKNTVFGFDTMWVTSVDNYDSYGVVFKGNIRSKDMAATYKKLTDRMKGELGDGYMLFLVQDKDEKPTAVVMPSSIDTNGRISKTTEVWLAVVFALMTAVVTLNANNFPLFDWVQSPYTTQISTQDFYEALPGSVALWFALGSHEWGHLWAASRRNVDLYLPLVIPSFGFGFLGSFGSITRVRGFMPNREALLDVAMSGPLVGTGVAATLTLVGFLLSSAGVTDMLIDSVNFSDSLLIGCGAQVFLGDALNNPEVEINSLLIAGWSALVFNALNLIPTGELDGGRITLAVFGRRPSSLFSLLTIFVLAITSLNSTLSFYWVALVLVLQRGPVLPCQEEISEPKDTKNINAGLALLALPLLVLVPYPVEFVMGLQNLGQPAPF